MLLIFSFVVLEFCITTSLPQQSQPLVFCLANNSTLGESAAGQTIGYATLEVERGINFVLNVPIMQEMMREAGAPVIVDTLQCAMCPSSVLPANAMIYFSSANPVDMGKALDIFASEEMQRWMFANMAPHANIVDQGVVVFNN